MRIAVLGDIHGNLPAFEAALDHVARQHMDLMVILGDIVIGSPDSTRCWQLARRQNCPMIRGNHERYTAHFGTVAAEPAWATEQFAPLQWAARQLSAAARAEMELLPLHLRLPEAPELLFVHASLRNDRDSIRAHTPDAELDTMFPDISAAAVVRGHNHVGALRIWHDRLLITAGSVGLPLDGNPSAQYTLLEHRLKGWQVQHIAVPYDVDAAVARFERSGYLDATGVIGRLYQLEVATASFHIVPFLRAYQRWNAQEPIGLWQAYERFYNVTGR
jgi:predicted phosphodiesterase